MGAAFQPRSCAFNDLNGFNDFNDSLLTANSWLLDSFFYPLDMGSRVIIYYISRITQDIEGGKPPCLIPTLNSNPHWLLALAGGGFL